MSRVQPMGAPTVININTAPGVGGVGSFPCSSSGDSYNSSGGRKRSFLGKVSDFVTGFGSAAINMVFSFKGLATLAAGAALVTFFPIAAPLVVAAGVGLSGFGLVNAVKNDDYKAAGGNAFGLLLGIVGARGSAGSATPKGLLTKIWSNAKEFNFTELASLGRSELNRGVDGLKNIGKLLTNKYPIKDGTYDYWGQLTKSENRNAHLKEARKEWEKVRQGDRDTWITTFKDSVGKLSGQSLNGIPGSTQNAK